MADGKREKAASAIYKTLHRSRPPTSEFHKTCAPTKKTQLQVQLNTTSVANPIKDADVECDIVTQDKVWKNTITRERGAAKTW